MNMKRKLISLINDHEVIYNTTLSEYKDSASRIEAWNQISKDMKMTVENCKIEWVKIRNSYVNALKRRHILQQRGKTLPPWLYEAEMSFLKPYVTGRSSDTIPLTVLLPDHPYEVDNDATSIESIRDEDERRLHKTPKLEETYEINLNEEYPEEYKINESSLKTNINEMDESDLFFLAMSQTFKKLPKIEQCRLKMDLFKILNDAEMRHLSVRKRKAAKRNNTSDSN